MNQKASPHNNTARAMLQGKGHDVWEMMVENIP